MTTLIHYWEHLDDLGIYKQLLEDDAIDTFEWAMNFIDGEIIPVNSHLYCVFSTYTYHVAVHGDWGNAYRDQLNACQQLLERLLKVEADEAHDCHCNIIQLLRWAIRSQEAEIDRMEADYHEYTQMMRQSYGMVNSGKWRG